MRACRCSRARSATRSSRRCARRRASRSAEFVASDRAACANARSEAAVDELLRELVDAIRYGDYLRAEGPESAERLDNVRELITSAAELVADELGEVGLRPLDHFLQRASSSPSSMSSAADADAVTLMTLHNAKGLEFPVVFITGLEDGLFPLAKAYDDPPLLEEERRLVLRRHHARRAKAVPHARRGATAQRRAAGVAAVELSRRHSGADGRVSAARSRCAARVARSCAPAWSGSAPAAAMAVQAAAGAGRACFRAARRRRGTTTCPLASRPRRVGPARRSRSARGRSIEDESQDARGVRRRARA